jgi:hypothetical protein
VLALFCYLKEDEMKQVFTMRIQKQYLLALRRLARESETSSASIVRRLIKEATSKTNDSPEAEARAVEHKRKNR